MTTTVPARREVLWRTIFATISSVAVTLLAVVIVRAVSRVLTWMAIALLLAMMLGPAVDKVQQWLRCRRGWAVTVVMLVTALLIAGAVYVFVRPIIDQSGKISEGFPQMLRDARHGRGPIGDIVRRFHLEDRLSEKNIRAFTNSLSSGGVRVAQEVGNALAATVTIVTLTILMLVEGPALLAAGTSLLSERTAERWRRIGGECSRAVGGYFAGNLLISVIAGVAAFAFLTIAGVPFAGVLALWIAITDLIPLIGATLGAVITVLVAFVHSMPVGIATIVFFIVYQLFENHVLQVTVMSRTVNLNPLVVLVSILLGVDLLGLLGAFAAIPVAGVVQILGRELWHHRSAVRVALSGVPADERPPPDAGPEAPMPPDPQAVAAPTPQRAARAV